MGFLKNLHISTVSWVFVIILTVAGGAFIASSLVAVENASSIRAIWDEFQAGRSEKARALNLLRREIGYGGMIHKFKNFVLRQDATLIAGVNTKLGAAAAAVSRYRAFAPDKQEIRALGYIDNMLGAYAQALSKTSRLIAEGKSPSEIDALVKVDDIPALGALDTLDEAITDNVGAIIMQAGKPQILTSLRKAMGYGGMIHHFKNFVLRHDHGRIQVVEVKLDAARKAVEQYQSHELNNTEQRAILDIYGVIEAYGRAIVLVDQMADGGTTVADIDKAVSIDDGPALRGFDTLTREIAKDSETKATQVEQALVLVSSVARTSAWATLVMISLLIGVSLWLFRYRIIGPLTNITGVMTDLARGDLDIRVPGAGQDNEIGEMARAVKIFKDNAIERERAEEEVRNREARIGAILENVIDGIITIDEHGKVETFNRAAENIFGYEAHEVIGRNVRMLMPDPYHREHDGYLAHYRETGEARIMGGGREVEGQHKDGSVFPLELAVGEMQIDTRRMFTGIVRDITERKQAEQMKNEFVSTVSHELRTPLTSIKGSLGLIRAGAAGDMPDKLLGMLDIAYNNSDRLIRLINDILDMEKISAGKMDFNLAPLDLNELIEESVLANKGYGEDRDVGFKVTETIDDATASGDHDRLMQVMANLLSNAAKFSPAGDCVDICLTRVDGKLRVSVIDHGPGISEAFQKQIFEKFSQADSSDTRRKGGTGLGLSISKAIVEQHGGEIGFETVPDEGTTFYFELVEPVGRTSHTRPENGEDSHILHIEDEEDVIEIVSTLVEGVADVVSAKSCAEARKLIESETFDLIILDMILPDGDGKEVLSLIKHGTNSGTPVVVFSAMEVEADGDMIHMAMIKSRTTNEVLLRTIKSALGV